MEDLKAIREEIDAIDAQLLPLLCRRMDCSLRVAAYKAARGLPVLNAEREGQILDRVRAACREEGRGEYAEAAALVFSSTMDVSRALQHRVLGAGRPLREALEGAARALLPADKARVVCQGCAGAYSDEAAGRMFPLTRETGHRPLFVPTWADVLEEVRTGRAEYGVLPVENSSTGSVGEVYDLIMAGGFTIAAAVELPISHCLLGLPGARLADIREVCSHPQGLSQCEEAIAAHGWKTLPYGNTAMAAQMVAQAGNPSLAAIASRKAGDIYGLEVLSDSIQSVDKNCTRFIAITSRLTLPPDADKISLIFSLPHTTGSLYRALARFALAGLNLTKIESRPIRDGGFHYAFYLDFEGSVSQPETQDLLCALSEEMPAFTFLGNYRELGQEE